MTSVPGEHCRAQRSATDATRAYVTATPWKSRGGGGAAGPGVRCRPRRAAAAAHWRVSGVVGQTTATRWTARARSRSRASSSAGRVLPAPGAAERRNGPADHARIATSAASCHARSDTDGWRRGLDTEAACCEMRRTERNRPRTSGAGRADPGVGLDLDQHPRVGQRGDDDGGVDRPDVAERLAVGAGEAVEMADVGEEDPRADHLGEGRPDPRQGRLDVRDRLDGLRVRVADPADRAVRHRGGAAGDDDEVAGADHPRVADDVLVRAARAMALDGRHQWRKWRRPVSTIATPARSAASIDSLSRLDPPGWTITLTPASIASSGPSANGKNASDASTAPRRWSRRHFSRARRTESTRLIWPAPTPTVAPPRASTIAFERTWRQTRQANSTSAHSSSLGARLVTTSIWSRPSPTRSRSCTSRPPLTWRSSFSPSSGMRRSWSSSRRTSGLAFSTSSAPSS